MIRSLYSGVSGMKNHQIRMDVVGNNIANVNTTGYKSGRVNFEDTLYQTIRSGDESKNAAQVGTGMSVSGITNDFTTGPSQSTGRTLDLAIDGNGMFVLQNDKGERFLSRDGIFYLTEDNRLVNSNGLRVCDNKGEEIRINVTPTPGSNGTAGKYEFAIDSTGFADGDTITIDGVQFTAVNNVLNDNEFKISNDSTKTILENFKITLENLKSAIEGNADLKDKYSVNTDNFDPGVQGVYAYKFTGNFEAGDSITIDGEEFVATGNTPPGDHEFTTDASLDNAIANLASALSASGLFDNYVFTPSAGTLTITQNVGDPVAPTVDFEDKDTTTPINIDRVETPPPTIGVAPEAKITLSQQSGYYSSLRPTVQSGAVTGGVTTITPGESPVPPGSSKITSIIIDEQGKIYVNGSSTPADIGGGESIGIAMFNNFEGLERVGENLYRETPSSGEELFELYRYDNSQCRLQN